MLLNILRRLKILLVSLFFIVSSLLINSQIALADDEVSARSITLSNSSASANSNYLVSFILNNTTTLLNTIEIQFCSNSPLIVDPCDVPTGMNTTSAVLNSEIGNNGFVLDNSVNGALVLNRNAQVPNSGTNYYQFINITNPSYNGEYYARVRTFSTSDTSGPDIEYGGFALAISPNLTINTIVPPYISFCLAVSIPNLSCSTTIGDSLDLGDFQTYSSNSGSYQFLVASNSPTGYSVSVYGTTLTSGNYTIPSLSSPSPPQYGVSQFGINLVANTQPNVGADPVGDTTAQPTANYGLANQFTFNDGDAVAIDTKNGIYTRFTNSVMVNISKSQPAGVYSTTLTYIAVANF
jgi:hypothetical protein